MSTTNKPLTKTYFMKYYKQGDWVQVIDNHNYSDQVFEIGGDDMTPAKVWNEIKTRWLDDDRAIIVMMPGDHTEGTFKVLGARNDFDLMKAIYCTLSYVAQMEENQVNR